jgi:hypothetical protein
LRFLTGTKKKSKKAACAASMDLSGILDYLSGFKKAVGCIFGFIF